LNEAFSSLNDRDKYEAVLTGLCAKIIDGGEKNANRESLLDPMRLMEEMNSSGIIAGPRGIIGLIDVRVDQKQNTQIYISVCLSLSLERRRMSILMSMSLFSLSVYKTTGNRIIIADFSGQTKVEELHIPFTIEAYVIRLNISVNDFKFKHVT
jgi:hypothetical protein